MPWRPSAPGELPTLGAVAVKWIEANCIIPDGPKKDQPFRLYKEQKNHLLRKYELDPDARPQDGNDAFIHGGSMLVRGQKWGKDPLLAVINLFHALGPCDFDGWNADGRPVGKPHPSPWVAVAATNDEQTDNTWLPLVYILREGPLADTEQLEIYDTFVSLPGGNPIEPLTTTAFGRLGGRFTHVSLTETGILIGTGPRGGLTFARTLKRNVGGMNGMWSAATNAWDPTEHSDAQETFEAKDPHVFVDANLSSKHVDLDDDVELEREVIRLYGDSVKSAGGHVSPQRIIRDCRNKAYGESEVRRFYLSEVTAGAKTFVKPQRWAALQDKSDPLIPDQAIALGFDGSRSRDATSLVACRLSDCRLFHLQTWFPAEYDDHKVPRPEVDRAISDSFEAYEVHYLFADPFRWQDYLDLWAGRYPKRVVEFPTNVEIRMDQAVHLFLDAVTNDELSHDGHPTLTEHIGSAALAKGKRKPIREDDQGMPDEHYLKVVKKREGQLIDAAVAAVLAVAARGQAIEDGALEQDDQEFFSAWR